MKAKVWVALIGFSFVGWPAVSTANTGEKIRNDKVLVNEETLSPGERVAISGEYPDMIVQMTDGAIEVSQAGGAVLKTTVKRGDIAYRSAQKRTIKNVGPSALIFVHVEFLTKGLDEVWGMKGLAPNYKILIENRYARSYDIRIPAQTSEPQHTHHARVIVSLAGAELEHILPDGTKQPSTLKTGEIAWRPAATHIGHNMGHTDLWVIAIEPK